MFPAPKASRPTVTSSLVDISSLHAVESLFRGATHDPWASQLAGDLADLAIYSEQVRYPLPASSATEDARQGPAVLLQLISRDSSVFVPQPYSTDNPRTVADEHLEGCLEQFCGWCRANPETAKTWVSLHEESWITDWHSEHIPHRYVFDVSKVSERADVRQKAEAAGLTLEGFLYAFDVVLRYPMYGELAGEGCAYLNHPIRDTVTHPSLEQAPTTKPVGAISFAKTFASLAPHITQDEYTSLLHELRGSVRDLGIHRVKPGQIERDVVRELAAKVALPARLGEVQRKLTLAAGITGGIGAFPVVGPVGPVLGLAVSIAQAYWDGSLPRSVSRVRWLRWAIQWDIETQAQRA